MGSLLQGCAGIGSRDDELNLLCWEGYNTERVIRPFRIESLKAKTKAKIKTQTDKNDLAFISRLRGSETNTSEINQWDLISLKQPYPRSQLFPENLIKPLNKDRFISYFDVMMDYFKGPYPYVLDNSGQELIGMPQRFGPFNFVVNTKSIRTKTAEQQGFKLFLDPKMKNRYAVLALDDWSVVHVALAADLDPSKKLTADEVEAFRETAVQIYGNAKFVTESVALINQALVQRDIRACFTGGTHTASIARIEGHTQIKGITPEAGPVDGKGGVAWVEITSRVNNPNPTKLAEDFLEYLQRPEISKIVAFSENTHNPVAQMGNPETFNQFLPEELTAIQWESLPQDMERSFNYPIVPSYSTLLPIITEAKLQAQSNST